MTELSRNLLAAAREGLAPDPAIAARVRARVMATVGATAVVAPAVTGKATAGATALKLGGMMLVLGIVAGAFVAMPRTERALAPHVTTATADLDEPHVTTSTAVSESQAPAAHSTVVGSRPDPVVAARPAAARATLAREVELIDRAMLALRQGTPTVALQAIALFERETLHRGQMAEDAAAIKIEAHCRLKHDVSPQLAAFDLAYPSSAQRARLAQACR